MSPVGAKGWGCCPMGESMTYPPLPGPGMYIPSWGWGSCMSPVGEKAWGCCPMGESMTYPPLPGPGMYTRGCGWGGPCPCGTAGRVLASGKYIPGCWGGGMSLMGEGAWELGVSII